MLHVIGAFIEWLIRRLWANVFKILAFLAAALLVWLVWDLYPHLSSSELADRERAIEIILLAFGSFAIILLAAQLRQQTAWNKVLSYHQFFSDVPKQDKVVAFRDCFVRLGIPKPTVNCPLSDAHIQLIFDDKGDATGAPARREEAIHAVYGYLDDLEEFCAAVNAGVVSDSYARNIEGSRVIRAYFSFAPLIERIRQDQETHMAPPGQQPRSGSRSEKKIRSMFYDELQRVAERWRVHREEEHTTLQGIRRWLLTKLGLDGQV